MGDTLQIADLGAALPPNPLAANATSLGAPQIATGKTTPVSVPKNSEDNLTVARRQREQGENPSHDPNAQNPHSSAGGTNQIIDSTWLELLTKHKPGLVEGKTKEELLAMKLDGNLNTEMANAYDRDNAKFLASNGIAPTPNFLNAAYRAGPQGAMAIIQAAHTNPNALVKDVAPDMGKPGNNGAGDLTVGQFLMNPYQRGPGADANQSPQQLFTIAKGNQILSQLQTELDQGKARVAKLDRDYKPIEFPTMPKPPEVDPLQTFGSLAGVFATLAAGFSRTPMTAALNGLAGAMHAAKEAKWDDYKAHYDQFKFGTEMAIKAHEMHSADIKDALEMMQKNMAAGSAMLTATIELSQDEEARKDHAIGHYIRLGQRQDEKDKNALEIKNGLPVYYATVDLTTALENLKHAQKGGDPNEITQAEGLVTQAENKLAGIKRALAGGGGISGLSNPVAVMIDGKPGMAIYNKSSRAWETPEGAPIKGEVVPTKEVREQQKAGVTESTPEQREAAAAQATTGMPVIQISPGYGQGAAQMRKQIHDDAISKIMRDTGMSATDAGIELANRTIEFQAGKVTTSQLTRMQGFTETAISQLDFNIEKAKQEMAKLPSTDLSPLINAVIRGEERWTGDPAYSALYYYMHATAMESARILSGGQASIAQLNQGAADEARKWADISMTPASFNAVAHAMHEEGQNRLKNYDDALKKHRVSAPGQSQSVSAPPPEAIEMLRKDPGSAAHFDEVFGSGSAKRVLGQ